MTHAGVTSYTQVFHDDKYPTHALMSLTTTSVSPTGPPAPLHPCGHHGGGRLCSESGVARLHRCRLLSAAAADGPASDPAAPPQSGLTQGSGDGAP